jgi:hypothetical protein
MYVGRQIDETLVRRAEVAPAERVSLMNRIGKLF